MAIQDKLPKSRITLRYPTTVQGQKKEVELPLKMMVIGDLSQGSSKDRQLEIEDREARQLHGNNLNAVMKDMAMTINCKVENKIDPKNCSEIDVQLPIEGMHSFNPEKIAENIPKVNSLLLMKKLLLELQSVVDNKKEFRRKLNELLQNKQSVNQIKEKLNGFQNYRLPTHSQ
ncbi:type VI secretion system contractile sheath small subunit [Piscirickettsia litoralis]|uniref:Type VI secretion system-associated protein n=1 Tax=Piscirickettsia litoralis TaxID=1891921 RepID=A0ABX3A058_9GAMM|nr:type VI secretion system contractile sheath small subunit [Piscirickettsia litoralis]ODN42212.1 type VI secretion system-associated protein [Piscirickettsia litoralis]